MVDRLVKEYEGKIEFRLLNAGTDAEATDLMMRFGVTAVPTFVFLGSDGANEGKIIGAASEQELRAKLDSLK